MKRFALVGLLLLSLVLLGCTDEEQKEFENAVIKQAIDDANPFKGHATPKPTPRSTFAGDDRQACSEPGEKYVCQDGTLYKSKCDGLWEWKEYVGPYLETCDGYYQKISCNGYTLVDTGSIDEQTYCLASGAQLGKTYCRAGEVKHQIVNCEENGQVCKETSTGIHQCMTAPPKGYCDYDYLNHQCPISCVATGSEEPGKQCIQVK